jgi:hypothetical protein
MNDVIGSIRSHSSIQLPSDRHVETKEYNYDLSYLESQMRGFDFENYLSRLDMEIARGLFLPELVFGGSKGGSYALGSAQIQAFYTNLMGIMDNIVDYINLYLLPQLIEYNFDKNKSASFTYQPLSVDQKKNIQELIMALVKLGKIKPDTRQMEDRSGIKLQEQIPPAPIKASITKKEVKTVAQKEIQDALSMEKEKLMEKEMAEVLRIKQELTSLYPDE